jgi:hypothetical protein
MVSPSTDEGLKSAAYLSDVLRDPKVAFSEETEEAPMNAAFKTSLRAFPWYESEGNEYRHLRFNLAMDGSKHATRVDAILDGICHVFRFSHMLTTPNLIGGCFRFRLEGSQRKCRRSRCGRWSWQSVYGIGTASSPSPVHPGR